MEAGDSRENWIGYLISVTVLCMILMPLSGAVIDHLCGNEEINENRKQTAFASYQNNDIQVDGAGNQVVVTVYKSRFHWIIQQTEKCYPERYVQMVGRDETGSAGDLKCSAGWREHFLVSVSDDKKQNLGQKKQGEVIAGR